MDIKFKVAEKLNSSDLPVITIQPTLYMGNMTAPWAAPSIVNHGTLAYPLPEQQKVSWVSWESMGQYVAAAVEHPELAGNSYRIGGAEALSGADMAGIYANHLSKPITYYPIALNDFKAGLNESIGEPVGTEIAKLYTWFTGDGAKRLDVDNSEITKALGITPDHFKHWVKSIDWQSIANPT